MLEGVFIYIALTSELNSERWLLFPSFSAVFFHLPRSTVILHAIYPLDAANKTNTAPWPDWGHDLFFERSYNIAAGSAYITEIVSYLQMVDTSIHTVNVKRCTHTAAADFDENVRTDC